jgi:hypothetical protein
MLDTHIKNETEMCFSSFLFVLLSCQIIDNFLATLANYLIIHSTNKSAIFANGNVRQCQESLSLHCLPTVPS